MRRIAISLSLLAISLPAMAAAQVGPSCSDLADGRSSLSQDAIKAEWDRDVAVAELTAGERDEVRNRLLGLLGAVWRDDCEELRTEAALLIGQLVPEFADRDLATIPVEFRLATAAAILRSRGEHERQDPSRLTLLAAGRALFFHAQTEVGPREWIANMAQLTLADILNDVPAQSLNAASLDAIRAIIDDAPIEIKRTLARRLHLSARLPFAREDNRIDHASAMLEFVLTAFDPGDAVIDREIDEARGKFITFLLENGRCAQAGRTIDGSSRPEAAYLRERAHVAFCRGEAEQGFVLVKRLAAAGQARSARSLPPELSTLYLFAEDDGIAIDTRIAILARGTQLAIDDPGVSGFDRILFRQAWAQALIAAGLPLEAEQQARLALDGMSSVSDEYGSVAQRMRQVLIEALQAQGRYSEAVSYYRMDDEDGAYQGIDGAYDRFLQTLILAGFTEEAERRTADLIARLERERPVRQDLLVDAYFRHAKVLFAIGRLGDALAFVNKTRRTALAYDETLPSGESYAYSVTSSWKHDELRWDIREAMGVYGLSETFRRERAERVSRNEGEAGGSNPRSAEYRQAIMALANNLSHQPGKRAEASRILERHATLMAQLFGEISTQTADAEDLSARNFLRRRMPAHAHAAARKTLATRNALIARGRPAEGSQLLMSLQESRKSSAELVVRSAWAARLD